MHLEYCLDSREGVVQVKWFVSRSVVTFEALIRKCWVSLLERTSKCYNICLSNFEQ